MTQNIINFNDTAAPIVEQLGDGTIARTPLLQQGQTFGNLAHGWHNVTGGNIHIGNIGRSLITKVTGIRVNNMPPFFDGIYVPKNQPFNRNFACVLYEMRAAGLTHVSYLNLDTCNGHTSDTMFNSTTTLHNSYVQSFKASKGLGTNNPILGQTTLTDSLINGIAK